MNHKKASLLAWTLCGIIAVVTVYGVGRDLLQRDAQVGLIKLVGDLLWSLLPILVRVVEETMQPEQVSVWLKTGEKP